MLFPGLMLAAGCKLLFEASLFRHLSSKQMTPLRRSALLMTGVLARSTKWRFALGVVGGLLLPALWLGRGDAVSLAWPLFYVLIAGQFVTLAAGELLERYLFFTAVVASRMPGSLRT
jgi:hypothetical protein